MSGHSREKRIVNPDFSDMLSALNAQETECMIVGAYALAAHGYLRATGDIDIWSCLDYAEGVSLNSQGSVAKRRHPWESIKPRRTLKGFNQHDVTGISRCNPCGVDPLANFFQGLHRFAADPWLLDITPSA
jgi:hypothetical protein